MEFSPPRNDTSLSRTAKLPEGRVPGQATALFSQKIIRTSFEHFLSSLPLIITLFPKAKPAFNGGSKF
jgi:hypothetical protein